MCHTIVVAIEVGVAMAYSGIVGWVNGIHDENTVKGVEGESRRARVEMIPDNAWKIC